MNEVLRVETLLKVFFSYEKSREKAKIVWSYIHRNCVTKGGEKLFLERHKDIAKATNMTTPNAQQIIGKFVRAGLLEPITGEYGYRVLRERR